MVEKDVPDTPKRRRIDGRSSLPKSKQRKVKEQLLGGGGDGTYLEVELRQNLAQMWDILKNLYPEKRKKSL